MTFSVIIPTYNRAKIVADAINSVLHQSYPDFEVIVVDDGSTDNTRSAVENITDHRVRYYYKKNEERSIARNYGADQAKGRYLIFLDSDDRMDSKHLEAINNYFVEKAFKPRFLFSGFVVRDKTGKAVYEYKRSGDFPAKKLFYGNYLGCSSVVVERALFNKYRFNTDPDLIVFEDWELWMRIISGEELHCMPSASIVMMNHEGRSVLNYSAAQLEKKAQCFISAATNNNASLKNSSSARRKLKMGLYSYIALHVALTKESRAAVFKFLAKALAQDPALVLKKRFYAIIKHSL